jgi:TolA-binding protein
MKALLICFLLFTLSACSTTFTTREDGVGSRGSVPPISEVRKKNAELTSKLMNFEEDLRIKNGRIEELEVYIKQLEKQNKSELKTIIEERDAYKESLAQINKEKVELLKELAMMKEEYKETNQKLKWANTPAKDMLSTGDSLFEAKKWTEAVSAYQSYREKTSNKKSADYAMVTYKIGVCFQELGLNNEAKTFYKSVIDGFDKNFKAHKFASYRLSQLSQ